MEASTVSNRHHSDNDRKLVLCNLHKLTNALNQQPPLSFRTIKSRNPIGFGHLQKLDYRLQVLKNTVPAKLTFGKQPHAKRGLGKNVEAWWCLECIERQLNQATLFLHAHRAYAVFQACCGTCLQQISAKARVLYPPLAPGRTSIVPSTADVDKQTIAAMGQPHDDFALNALTRAMDEEALGRDGKISDQARTEFWKLQEALNTMTAVAPDYSETCELRIHLLELNERLPPSAHFLLYRRLRHARNDEAKVSITLSTSGEYLYAFQLP